MAEPNEEEIKKKYFILQNLENEMRELQGQIQMVDSQIQELVKVEHAFEELHTLKKGSRAFVPIANGMFLPATLEQTDELLVAIGSKTFTKKKAEEVHAMVTEQKAAMQELQGQLHKNLQGMIKEAHKVHAFLVNALGIEE